jgi:hypothetical protein
VDNPVDEVCHARAKGWTTRGLSHDLATPHDNLCIGGDNQRTTISGVNWANLEFSTIHRPYHH